MVLSPHNPMTVQIKAMRGFWPLVFVLLYPLDLVWNFVIVAAVLIVSTNLRSKNVFLFVPNIIGYIRIAFLCHAATFIRLDPFHFLTYVFLSGLLDFIDGPIARRLKQTSKFGALLDLVCDNMARSLLYLATVFYSHSPTDTIIVGDFELRPPFRDFHRNIPWWFYGVVFYWPAEEWIAAMVLFARSFMDNKHWRIVTSDDHTNPWIIRQVFKNNSRSILGFWAVSSTYAVPQWVCLWLLGYRSVGYVASLSFWCCGRLLMSYCSLYIIYQFGHDAAKWDADPPVPSSYSGEKEEKEE